MQGNVEVIKYILNHFKNRRNGLTVPKSESNIPTKENEEHVIQLIHAGYLIGNLWVPTATGIPKVSPSVHGISWAGLELLEQLESGKSP